jgi:hypothetical protein
VGFSIYSHGEYTLVHSSLSITFPYLFPQHHLLFNSFHYICLYTLPSQMLCFMTLLMFYHSLFLSLLPDFHRVVSLLQTYSKWLCLWSCLFLYFCLSFASIFYVWEKTCSICLSDSVLLHLIGCLPFVSIDLQTIWCRCSLWLSKIPLCTYTTFLIHSSFVGYLVCYHKLAIVNTAVMSKFWYFLHLKLSLHFPWESVENHIILCSFPLMKKIY